MEETYRLINDFPIQLLHGKQVMAVVQQDPAASLLEWARVYRDFANLGLLSWIALPRVLGDRRVELIIGLCKLQLWNYRIKHHAFGMNAGSLDELPKLNMLGVYSCDSSAPVWRGLHGWAMNDATWPDILFDAGKTFRPGASTHALATHNLTEVFNACQSKWEIPSIIKAARISA